MVSQHSTDGRRPSTGSVSQAATNKSRLRLIVIQALVFSLFATLFVRLYYLQVVGGEEYHAQAASQSVREIVVQPQRGLIVDDMGRPLVANRTSWVVSVDRTMLDKMTERQRERLLERVARGRGPAARHRSASAWSPAATPAASSAPAGTARRTSPCRSPPTSGSRMPLRILEQPEDYPVRARRAAERARLPAAVRHQPRPRARLPQPDHRGRVRPGQGGRRPVRQRRLLGRPGRRREGVRPLAARDARLPARRGRLHGPRARRRQRGRRGSPATRWSPRSTPRSRGSWRSSSPRRSRPRAPDHGHRHRPQLRRRLRRRGRAGGEHRSGRRDGQPADVRPRRCGSAASPRTSWPGSTPRRPGPRCWAAPRRASSRRARRGSRS